MDNKRIVISPVQRILGEDFNPSLLIITVRRNFIWVVLFTLTTTAISLLYLRYSAPIYEATGSIIMSTQNTASQALNLNGPLSQFGSTQAGGINDQLANDMELIRSSELVGRILDSVPLTTQYYLEGDILTEEMYKQTPFIVEGSILNPTFYGRAFYLKYVDDTKYELTYPDPSNYSKQLTETFRFGVKYSNPILSFKIILNKTEHKNITLYRFSPELKYYFTIKQKEEVVKEVASNINVALGGNIIKIFYKDAKPQKAADIINTLADRFLKYDIERKNKSGDQIITFIDNWLDSTNLKLDTLENVLKTFKKQNHFITPESKEAELTRDIETIKNQLYTITDKANTIGVYADIYNSTKDSLQYITGLPEGTGTSLNGVALNLTEKLNNLQNQRVNYTDKSPRVISSERDIRQLKHALNNLLQQEVNSTEKQKDFITQHYTEDLAFLDRLPDIDAEFEDIERLKTLFNQTYILLLTKKSEFTITRAGFISDYTVLRSSETPVIPISPNKKIIELFGILSGLLTGIGIIIVRYLMNHSITSVAEVEMYSQAAIVGVIPKYRNAMDVSQLIVNKSPKSLISEAFRTIRSNLEFINPAPGVKVITVTSTVAGEGKTFVALNTAGIMAVSGKRTVVLDFDLRKPRLHKAFGVENLKGVSTILIGKHTIEECIKHSEWENIDYITAGPLPPNPAEFIKSKQTMDFIATLKTMYDVVVIDTAPVGIVTDALELMKMADYPLYVIRADYSSRNFINTINRLVVELKITKLSVVMNYMGEGASYYSYNYGYSYGYGYGYGYSYGYGGGKSYGHGYYTDDEPASKGGFNSIINFIKSFF